MIEPARYHRLHNGQEIMVLVSHGCGGTYYAAWMLNCPEATVGLGRAPRGHKPQRTEDCPTPEEAIQAAVDAATEETATGRLLPCCVYEGRRHVVKPGGCESRA